MISFLKGIVGFFFSIIKEVIRKVLVYVLLIILGLIALQYFLGIKIF